jgi:hypothetical protein
MTLIKKNGTIGMKMYINFGGFMSDDEFYTSEAFLENLNSPDWELSKEDLDGYHAWLAKKKTETQK